MKTFQLTRMTQAEWYAEAERRFGEHTRHWKFVCPICKHVASHADYREAGAPDGAVGFSCIGRYLPGPRDAFGGEGPGPCNYTGGGLFPLNPIIVVDERGVEHVMFAFADVDAETTA